MLCRTFFVPIMEVYTFIHISLIRFYSSKWVYAMKNRFGWLAWDCVLGQILMREKGERSYEISVFHQFLPWVWNGAKCSVQEWAKWKFLVITYTSFTMLTHGISMKYGLAHLYILTDKRQLCILLSCHFTNCSGDFFNCRRIRANWAPGISSFGHG